MSVTIWEDLMSQEYRKGWEKGYLDGIKNMKAVQGPNRAVQICVTPETEDSWAVIYALADDGTMWKNTLVDGSCGGWTNMELAPLPQPAPGAAEEEVEK